MDLENMEKYLREMSFHLAKTTYQNAARNGDFSAQYLWYRESNSMTPGQLCISEENPGPECWKLAWQERIPYNLTVEQFSSWIRSKMGSLPILPLT